ncbi:MAG: hypothetical protein HYS21_10415 [Deltaproteobacteria bacterium]|nr:hypothetical protein [Deltaproteobacteria bacterium]
MAESFKFFECYALIRMTGRKASDILEFMEILKQVSAESIFHHVHQYFLKPHISPPDFSNDFAVWAAENLGEQNLAEALANLNPFEFSNVEDIRAELIRIITEHLKSYPPPRPVLPGKEFFFNESITIVVPTGLEATQLHDFAMILKEIDYSSIYFHFYEARLRLGKERDDFSHFLDECLDCPTLAARIKSFDPYMYTTEDLRAKIIKLLEEAL